MSVTVDVKAISKSYGKVRAVRDLSFQVLRGEVFGLLGANGAGKTTTIEILATLQRPDSGSASVMGFDVVQRPDDVRRQIGIVFESNAPPRPHWTVRDYLSFFAALKGGELDMELLGQLQIDAFFEARTGELSGGQKKRVELARALLGNPPLLILDEPSKELDLRAKRAVWETIKSLARRRTTILMSSHDVLEIKELCSTVGIIRDGRLSRIIPPASLSRLDHESLEKLLVESIS